MNIEFCWENLLEERLDIIKVDFGRYTVRIGGGWK